MIRDDEDLNQFICELHELICKYRERLSACEYLGALKLMADDISQNTRNFNQGPSKYS